jgi:hypothetical protein
MDVYFTTSPDDTFSPLIGFNALQQASDDITLNGDLGEIASSPFALPSPTVDGAWVDTAVLPSISLSSHTKGTTDGLVLASGVHTRRLSSASHVRSASPSSSTTTLLPATESGGSLFKGSSNSHGLPVSLHASTGDSRTGNPRLEQIISIPEPKIRTQPLPVRDGKALPKSDATWARYRPIITALYSNKDLRLKDLQHILSEEYGFDAR